MHTPSEAYLYDYFRKQTSSSFGRIELGIITGVTIVFFLNIVSGCYMLRMRRQMHDLSLVVLGIHQMIPMTEQFELKKPQRIIAPAVTTVNPVTAFASWAYFIDWTVALYLVIISLIFCFCLALGLKYALSRRSYLYVEIGAQSHIIQLRVMRFPTAY